MTELLKMIQNAVKVKHSDDQVIIVRAKDVKQVEGFRVKVLSEELEGRSVGFLEHDELRGRFPVSFNINYPLDVPMVLVLDHDKTDAYKTVLSSTVEQVLHSGVRSEIDLILDDVDIADALETVWYHSDTRRKLGTFYVKGVKVNVLCGLDGNGADLEVSIRQTTSPQLIQDLASVLFGLVYKAATPFQNMLVEVADAPEELRHYLTYEAGGKKYIRLPEGRRVEYVISQPDDETDRSSMLVESFKWNLTPFARLSPIIETIRELDIQSFTMSNRVGGHTRLGKPVYSIYVEDKAAIGEDTVVLWLPEPSIPAGIIEFGDTRVQVYIGDHTEHANEYTDIYTGIGEGVTLLVD